MESIDPNWMLSKIVEHEREHGKTAAEVETLKSGLDRVEKAMAEGFQRNEARTAELVNHIRGSMEARFDALAKQRDADMANIAAAIQRSHEIEPGLRRIIYRVALGLIAAFALIAIAQTSLGPQVAGLAAGYIQRAIGQ